jgi:hypothetical protein
VTSGRAASVLGWWLRNHDCSGKCGAKRCRDRWILPTDLLYQVAVPSDLEKSCGELNSSLARNNAVNICGLPSAR